METLESSQVKKPYTLRIPNRTKASILHICIIMSLIFHNCNLRPFDPSNEAVIFILNNRMLAIFTKFEAVAHHLLKYLLKFYLKRNDLTIEEAI